MGDEHDQGRGDQKLVCQGIQKFTQCRLQAMSPGGRIRVRTRANNGGVELALSDTGAGIKAEDLRRIFDPFFTTKQSGTGLGLSLTRRIIESHSGQITCESIPELGTTFTVSLPGDGQIIWRSSNGEGRASRS